MTTESNSSAPLGGAEPEGLEEFEDQLSRRTKVPSERLSDFLGWNEDKIRSEAKLVTRILKRFAEAVVQSMEDPDSVNGFLLELDLKTISRDHDWRSIFSSVRAAARDAGDPQAADQETGAGDGAAQDEEQRLAQRAVLIKYLQYLSFRKRLLDFIHARKAGLEETDELSADLTRIPTSAGEPESSVVRLGVAGIPLEDFERMPLGHTVEVTLEQEDTLEFLLARRQFELVGGDHPYVVDRNGVTCFVRPGRNMMGRHPESDLAVDANFSDVSRAHMILEWNGDQQFRLMDLSSRGTWLRASILEAANAVVRPEDLLQDSTPE